MYCGPTHKSDCGVLRSEPVHILAWDDWPVRVKGSGRLAFTQTEVVLLERAARETSQSAQLPPQDGDLPMVAKCHLSAVYVFETRDLLKNPRSPSSVGKERKYARSTKIAC